MQISTRTLRVLDPIADRGSCGSRRFAEVSQTTPQQIFTGSPRFSSADYALIHGPNVCAASMRSRVLPLFRAPGESATPRPIQSRSISMSDHQSDEIPGPSRKFVAEVKSLESGCLSQW